MITASLKILCRRLLARFGLGLLHLENDPVIAELDAARDFLRLQRGDPARCHHALAQLALNAHLRDLLTAHRIDLVVDVGANRGQFARHIRALGHTGPIVSIEPQKRLAEALRAEVASSQPWTVLHGAVGAEQGRATLHTFSDDTFSSLHQPSPAALERFGDLLAPGQSETVEMRTLDAWLSGGEYAAASRILLKTDTQGNDHAVLRGAPLTLRRTCVVLTEAALVPLYSTATSPEEFAALLAPAGFRPAGYYAVSHDERDLAALELDCLFTRAPR